MSEPVLSGSGAEVIRSPLQLVRLPVDKPQPAVSFLNARSQGVMDLIAHFWERLPQTPPLQRSDLHLVVATPVDSDNINIPQLDASKFSGAMLYVPKAHRADVLALDAQTAAAFASYITHQGLAAARSDNVGAGGTKAAAATTLNAVTTGTSDSEPAQMLPLTDLSAVVRGTAPATELPGDANSLKVASGAVNGKVPIDFLTGHADGIAWMVPLLLPVVHRRAAARQLVNVVMQLPSNVPAASDANVRIAKDTDIPVLNRWRRMYKEERGILFDADLDAWVQTGRLFVYEAEKQVVAVAKFDLELPSLVEIGGVYTFPEFRQQGYGSRIVADLAGRIRAAGKVPTLQADEQNAPAVKLYESAGWLSMGKLARVWLTG